MKSTQMKNRLRRCRPRAEQLESRRLLTINIDLDQSTGPTIEQYGWDIKGGANLGNQSKADWYHSTGANILRIPFFPTAHFEDGSIDESAYSSHLANIARVRNANPNVTIFASLKLRGADTFPSWMETAESCKIFSHWVFKPDIDHYTDALVDYVEYFEQNGVKIDAFGVNNEVENCLTPALYTQTVEDFRTKLAATNLPEEYRSFDFVGPDTFRVRTGANYVSDIADPEDVVDISGIHFYPGSSDRAADLTNLKNLVGGDMWFTEVHMNPSNANKGQTPEDNFGKMRHGMATVLEANRQGANTFIWWNPGANTSHFDDEVKLELIGSTLNYGPVLTQNSNGIDNIQPYTNDDSAPFFQAFRRGDDVTIWVANGWEFTMFETFDLGVDYQIVGDVRVEYWTSDGADGVANDIDANGFLASEMNVTRTAFDVEIPSDSFAELTFSVAPFGTVIPPTVANVALNAGRPDPADLGGVPQPTSWREQRSALMSIAVDFTQQVDVGLDDISLTNLGTDAQNSQPQVVALASEQIALTGNTLTISFPDNGLPDGVYELELAASIENTHALSMDGNGDAIPGDSFVFRGNEENGFFKLTADWNGDAGVSVFDFTTFSYWFGNDVDVAPAYVDTNGDGGISVFDFTDFSQNFGVGLGFSQALTPTFVNSPRPQRNAVEREQSQGAIQDRALMEVLHRWSDWHQLEDPLRVYSMWPGA